MDFYIKRIMHFLFSFFALEQGRSPQIIANLFDIISKKPATIERARKIENTKGM